MRCAIPAAPDDGLVIVSDQPDSRIATLFQSAHPAPADHGGSMRRASAALALPLPPPLPNAELTAAAAAFAALMIALVAAITSASLPCTIVEMSLLAMPFIVPGPVTRPPAANPG